MNPKQFQIDKKSKIKPIKLKNNFFINDNDYSKSPLSNEMNSFQQFNKQDDEFIYDNQKQQLYTDRNIHKKNKKQLQQLHKRTKSTIKKQQNYKSSNNQDEVNLTTSRHPTPSTNVSTKFKQKNSISKNIFNNINNNIINNNLSNLNNNLSNINNNNKNINHNNKINKNISDLIKMPKKRILRDQQSLKGSIPGWPGRKVIQRFGPLLTQFQKKQLENQKEVFYIGVGTGNGQDDQQGSYQWKRHQQVGYRYQLLQPLGSGAFGQVIKAFDHKKKQHVAIKIIRSKKQHMQLALNQINILMKAKQRDVQSQKNILRIKDFIVFRKHICIITQLLSISLYQLLQSMNFQSIQLTYIRTFAIQILNALAFLKQIKVIHSDLKPENVMLKNKNKTGIKLIDFGTSMYSNQTNFLYIQSRFYRAPEVILGAKYSYQIDMWSFGCLLAELYLGEPIFAGANEQEQIGLIIECIGTTQSQQFLKKCKNASAYFNSDNTPKNIKNKQGKIIQPQSKKLFLMIQDKAFCQYLQRILVFDPKKRYTPLQALLDPWIMQGLPEQIKQQHLSFIRQKLKQQKKLKQRSKQRQKQKQSQQNQKQIKKVHKRSNTSDFHKDAKNNNVNKNKQSQKKQILIVQAQTPQNTTTKKQHSRRNSDAKYQDFNAKETHLRHRRRGSAGIF